MPAALTRLPRPDRSLPAAEAWKLLVTPWVVGAAIVTIPLVAAHVMHVGGDIVTALTWVVWGIFLAEVVGMLSLHPQPRVWARTHKLELLVVVAAFPALTSLGGLVLRAAKAGKLLKLVKLGKVGKSAKIVRRSTLARTYVTVVLVACGVVALLVLAILLGLVHPAR